jgi:hypothetical protein
LQEAFFKHTFCSQRWVRDKVKLLEVCSMDSTSTEVR